MPPVTGVAKHGGGMPDPRRRRRGQKLTSVHQVHCLFAQAANRRMVGRAAGTTAEPDQLMGINGFRSSYCEKGWLRLKRIGESRGL
ncbi:MAG TPA: hypothetical protein VGH36_04350 [Acetobacteraceae bacterium]